MTDLGSLRCVCPRCGEQLWAERAGEWTLRAAMLKVDPDGRVKARCPASGCSKIVDVTFLSLKGGKPTRTVRGRRLVVLDRSRKTRSE